MGLKKRTERTNSASSVGTSTNSSQNRIAEEQRRRARTLAKQQQAAERIASTTLTLSQGISDAVTARDQLNAAMEEIATGAEQAASASTEILESVTLIQKQISSQAENAAGSMEKTEALQKLFDHVGEEIGELVSNIVESSEKQRGSVAKMNKLQEKANSITDAVKQVMRIADQTNLLALNAAIEAGRAGKHGKGFAVVADTVRSLAETSESNASDITQLIEIIQKKTETVVAAVQSAADKAVEEANSGKQIVQGFDGMKSEMDSISKGAQEISTSATQMDIAIKDSQQGSEAIAAAAEEQSAACEQVLKSLDEQNQALSGAEQAAQELEVQSEELKNSTDITKSAEEVAAAAEELSTSIEEISHSSSEIMTAVAEIARGSEQAAAAAEQASAGMGQIETGARLATEKANNAIERTEVLKELLESNKATMEQLIANLSDSAESGKIILSDIQAIEETSSNIAKIIDVITTVSIKTSMLAVNGAIEAARAGEFGKGFAVVSEDIQNLADDTAENIEQIKELIKAIQNQSMEVMTDLQAITSIINDNVNNAKRSNKSLMQVESDVIQIEAGNNDILTASQEIAAAVEQSRKALEQVAAASEQASSNANESAAAAEQQAKGSEDLALAIEEIASIADELQSI